MDIQQNMLPFIPRMPVPPRTVKIPNFLGNYYFGDEQGSDVPKLFHESKNNKWVIVCCSEFQTQPGVFVPQKLKVTQKFKCGLSTMWLSACGRYVLYPPTKQDFPGFNYQTGEEADYFDFWLPKPNWKEYYTCSWSPGIKYCIQERKSINFIIIIIHVLKLLFYFAQRRIGLNSQPQ
jgi:hypothetical protein